MITFKEKLYSRSDIIRSIISNGDVACIDLIKCMEFYDSCPNDIPHWVNVATMKFNMMAKENDIPGGFLILSGLDKSFISSDLDRVYVSSQKRSTPEDAIRYFKKQIEIAKTPEGLKYSKLLKKDSKGSIIWKHSDKYYVTFFKYLALLLNFRLPISELGSFGIEEDEKIWGKPDISSAPVGIKESDLSKRDFENLILGYIYYMNYGCFDRNTELVRRIQVYI